MLLFSIYGKWKNRFRTVASPDAWPSWIDARRHYILLIIICASFRYSFYSFVDRSTLIYILLPFFSRVSLLYMRAEPDLVVANLSVCPTHSGIFYLNGCRCHQTLPTVWYEDDLLNAVDVTKFHAELPQLNTRRWRTCAILPCHAMRIGLYILYISAVFAVVRCPSVCPSVTLVHCIHMAEDIVKLLVRPGSPVTLVCWPLRRYQIPGGTPSAGPRGTKYTWVG